MDYEEIILEIDRKISTLRNEDSDFHQGKIAGMLQAKLIIRRVVASAEFGPEIDKLKGFPGERLTAAEQLQRRNDEALRRAAMEGEK